MSRTIIEMKKDVWDVFSLINKERFYCNISEDLQKLLVDKFESTKKSTLHDTLSISRSTLPRILYKKNYWINLQDLFNLCKALRIDDVIIKENILSIKTKNSFKIEKFKIEKSYKFARIVAHLLGDGGIHIVESGGKYRIFYVNNEKILLDTFESDIKSIFGNVEVYRRNRDIRGDEVWLPTTIGLIFFNIFNMYDCKLRRVPSFIPLMDKKSIGSFIGAFYDDEGYVYPDKKIIGLALSNPELLADVKNLLKYIGIESNPIHVTKSEKRTKMYYFNICGYENFKKFQKSIPILHSEKLVKVKELISGYR